MNSGVFKIVILGLLLVVLAFVVGSQAAESSKNALMVLGGLGGLFILLVAGRRSWWMIFILPPLLKVLPIGVFQTVPAGYLIAIVILAYWIVMWTMGYVRLTWQGVAWYDVLLLVFFCYIAVNFYRHPVSMGIFADETSAMEGAVVGGKAYAIGLCALIYLLTISLVPCSLPELYKVFKWAYVMTLVGVVFSLALGLAGVGAADMGEEMTEGRFGAFVGLGSTIIYSLACACPLSAILTSAWRSGLMCVGVFAVMLSGFRSLAAIYGMCVAFMSAVWRQFLLMCLMGVCGIGALYLASSADLLMKLPYGVQRTLCVLPGMKVRPEIAASATHSSDWRFEMWDWAMDPRAGYIHDYVWGDGCGYSVKESQLQLTHVARGRIRWGDKRIFAERGVWHSGPISTIQTMGYVGLALFLIVDIASVFMFWRVCSVVKGSKFGFFAMFLCLPIVQRTLSYYLVVGSVGSYMSSFFAVGMCRLVYSRLVKDGRMPPLFRTRRYVPLAIREHEASLEQKGAALQPAGM